MVINKTRGCLDMDKKRCCRCLVNIEDDQHILSKWETNKILIQKQHNRLMNKIGEELKQNNPYTKFQLEDVAERNRAGEA